jgi:hypothetical protein
MTMPQSDPHAPPDCFPPEPQKLLTAARQELKLHRNINGLCMACETPFLCERCCLAAFALEAV